jgi:hypothetical protein
MDRAEGSGSRQAALLSRWVAPRAQGGAPVAASPEHARGLLADVEAALSASFSREAALALLAPLREALEKPEDERDPEMLGPVFDLVEDVLDAAAIRAG